MIRLNLKEAWKAHFLSHTSITLKNRISFRDVQMILVSFSDIPNGYIVAKYVMKLHVQVIPRSMANAIYECPLNLNFKIYF